MSGPGCRGVVQPGKEIMDVLELRLRVTNRASRSRALGWSDISGNLWLFGGTGYANNEMHPAT
jgi:hypothetical protein